MSSDPQAAARTIGLRLLERSPRTRAQLAAAMTRRGIPDEDVEVVLDRFAEAGLIDDAAFATAWVGSRHHGRGLARRALAAELRARGVEGEVAQQALATVSTEDEVAAATALVTRRLRAMSDLPRPVQTRRLTAMLARKGFGSGLAHRVVSSVLDAPPAAP